MKTLENLIFTPTYWSEKGVKVSGLIDTSVKCVHIPEYNGIINGIPQYVEAITQDAFVNCQNLIDVVMPDRLLKFYYAFQHTPVYESLRNRYLQSIQHKDVMGCKDFPAYLDIIDDICVDMQNLREVEIPMNVKALTYTFARCRHLEKLSIPKKLGSMVGAFSECTSLKSIIIPEKVDKMNGALMGCDNLTEIAMLGAYKRPDVFGLQYTAEQVGKLILFSDEPMIIGSTPNAIWYVPERSIGAYKQALEDFNNREGMLTGYIYCRDIKPLQEASKGLKSLEIHKLLVDKGYAPKEIFNPDFMEARMEYIVEEYARKTANNKE